MTSNLLFNAMIRDMQTVILVMKLKDKKQLKKSCEFVGFHADDPSFDIFKVINKNSLASSNKHERKIMN